MSERHAEQGVAEHQQCQHQRRILPPPDCWKRELHLLPEQIDRKQQRYNDEHRTKDVVAVATTRHISGKYEIECNAIPCECHREIQLCEEGLDSTGFEEKPSDEQDRSNVENDLGRPDLSAVGFHNLPEFVFGYHAFPPKQRSLPRSRRGLTFKISQRCKRSAGLTCYAKHILCFIVIRHCAI